MWFFYAGISAIIYSLKSIFEKRYINRINKYILAFGVRLFALPFFVILFFAYPSQQLPINNLSWNFWLPTIWVCLISTPIEMLLFYEALKDEEVTYLVPFISLAPILTSLFGILIFTEFPTFIGLIGMSFIILGIYILNTKKAKEGFWEPFKYVFNNRPARLILIMLVFYSFGGIADKLAIKSSNTVFYSLMNYLVLSVTLFVICLFKARNHFKQLFVNFVPFIIIGTIVAGYTILRFLAFETGNTAYIQAIVSSSVIMTMLWGVLFLKEKAWRLKLIVGTLIMAGLILIKVFG